MEFTAQEVRLEWARFVRVVERSTGDRVQVTSRGIPVAVALNRAQYEAFVGDVDQLDPLELPSDPESRRPDWKAASTARLVSLPARVASQDLSVVWDEIGIRQRHVIVTRFNRFALVFVPVEWITAEADALANA